MFSTQQFNGPTEAAFDAYLDATAELLGLKIAPDWRPDVLFHLKAIVAAANMIQAYPLEDELEPAPIFRA